MTLNKTHLIVFCVGAVLGLLCGFFSGKAVYDQTIKESVTRDTVRVVDTVPQYFPAPKDSVVTRYITRYLPVHSTDTVDRYVVERVTDTVAVEIPITSKHYGSDTYDAWVSGYEPSLDSIKVYQRTEYITETITRMKPPNRFSFGLQGGYGYGFRSKTWEPYVGVGIDIRIF